MVAREASGRDDLWRNFNSDSYIAQNYKTSVLPEDVAMMEGMVHGLDELNVPAFSGEVVADVGNAGVFHYSGILQLLVAPGGRIEYTEYSPHGLHVARRTLEAYERTGDLGLWRKFGDKTVEIDERYGVGPDGEPIHPTERAFQLGKVVAGSIYTLKPNSYDGAGTFYCPCSISAQENDWNAATASFVGAVKVGKPVIVTAMKKSGGYTTPDPNGKIVFPAFPVDTDIVAGRLEELGVRDIQTADAFDPEHGARPADGPQYEGVCLAMGIRAAEVVNPTIII